MLIVEAIFTLTLGGAIRPAPIETSAEAIAMASMRRLVLA